MKLRNVCISDPNGTCKAGTFKAGTFTPAADVWVPSKVVFTLKGGGDSDGRAAKQVLKVGQTYEVERLVVEDWHSYLHLKGFDGAFNEAMFEQEAK